MPPRGIRRLSQLLIGEQTDLATKQTTMARAMRFRAATTIVKDRTEDRLDDSLGNPSLWGEQEAPERTGNMTTINMPTVLELNDILLPLLSGLQGGVSAVADSDVGGAYSWTFTPDMDASARSAVDYYTVQAVRRNAENGGTAQVVRTIDVPKVFCSQLVIEIPEGDGLVTANATYRGGKADDPGVTALVSPPALVTPPLRVPKKLTAVGIYDSWSAAAAAGAPAASNEIRSGTITIPMGLEPSDLVENNPDLDYTSLDTVPSQATVSLSIYGDTTASALEQEELAHREDEDLRFLKFRLNSSRIIDDNSDNLRPRMDIIMAVRHDADSLGTLGQADAQGREIIGMNFRAAADTAQSNGISVIVTNATAAFPA